MDYMILVSMLGVVAGLYLLGWAGDRVVYYAQGLARVFNLSSFFVGFAVLALAADIPEICVAITSAMHGVSQVSAGDIVGSNVVDVALVLGITIFFAGSMGISVQDRKKFLAILLGVSLLMGVLCLVGSLTRFHGVLLILIYLGFMLWSWYKKNERHAYVSGMPELSKREVILGFLISFVGMFITSSVVVHAAVFCATRLQMPLETVGATLLSIGTSLPELVLSLSALRRKEYELALGPTLGTVLCQATFVLGILAALSAQPIDLVPLHGALFFMFIAFFTMIYSLLKEEIKRSTGFALLSIFVGYLAYHFVPLY